MNLIHGIFSAVSHCRLDYSDVTGRLSLPWSPPSEQRSSLRTGSVISLGRNQKRLRRGRMPVTEPSEPPCVMENHIIHSSNPDIIYMWLLLQKPTKALTNDEPFLIKPEHKGGKYTITLMCDTSKWNLLKMINSNTHPSLNLSSLMTFMYNMLWINVNDE